MGDKVVVEPGGGPSAVFRRPLTVLQISDGIKRVLIHVIKQNAKKKWQWKRSKITNYAFKIPERDTKENPMLCINREDPLANAK